MGQIHQKRSTNLQAPNVANFVVLFGFWDRRTLNVPGLDLEPTLIGEMKQTYEAEARANLGKLIFGI
jgi:hypothetical protein